MVRNGFCKQSQRPAPLDTKASRRQCGPSPAFVSQCEIAAFSHADKDCLLHSIKKCVILHKVKESQSLTGKK